MSSLVICRQPVIVGSCRAAFPKFFYNASQQSCSNFVYGGCEGNSNNFETLDECEKTCSGITGNDRTSPESHISGKADGFLHRKIIFLSDNCFVLRFGLTLTSGGNNLLVFPDTLHSQIHEDNS